MYLKHGPNSNLMPLIEETVQKFKDDPKYKQDPRFVKILIKFVNILFDLTSSLCYRIHTFKNTFFINLRICQYLF